MPFFTLVIINKITWFSHWKVCFDLYASLIFLVLCGTNKILRAIVLLFCSNFFQSFECDGKSISFQLYWSIKGLIFDILWGFFQCFDDLMQQLKHTENNYHHYFLDLLLLFFIFQPFGRIYVASFQTYFWKR